MLPYILILALSAGDQAGQPVVEQPIHLRSGTEREWVSFPETAEAARLDATFSAAANTGEHSLLVRQHDVKQLWTVTLNGQKLGELARDENLQTAAFRIAPGVLKDGGNQLRIEGRAPSDDIRVGPVMLVPKALRDLLHEASVEVGVTDAGTHEKLPCRLTVLDEHGGLAPLGAASDDHHAARTGVVYTSTGGATFGLPAGRYTIFAGRGFEYTLDRAEIVIRPGDRRQVSIVIGREVDTSGYAACDTHIHTVTHSGHGDCTLNERMITLAGEGIELPIATDHNKHIDYKPVAERLGVRPFLTPVMGNEVTTSVGHFNVFPVAAGAAVPDHKATDWNAIFQNIDRTAGVKAVILNHARDIHSNTRPFGPLLHNAVAGANLDGWPMRFNAMEVINSGATQTESLRLLHDWMGVLNGGHIVTPVGSSDSHDVTRYIVGQGRTYIRCDDRRPGDIAVDTAANSFVQGRVLVSYGLLAELTVNGKYRSGEVARVSGDSVDLTIRVLGPHWVTADRVLVFANGQLIREIEMTTPETAPRGVKWTGTFTVPTSSHDMFLTAVAIGPGVKGLYWPMAQPYQPLSPEFQPVAIGCSGAVWVDADGDGRPTPARDYAVRLIAKHGGDLRALIDSLAGYDAAVAAQAAHLFQMAGGSLASDEHRPLIRNAPEPIRTGIEEYLAAWRETQRARGK